MLQNHALRPHYLTRLKIPVSRNGSACDKMSIARFRNRGQSVDGWRLALQVLCNWAVMAQISTTMLGVLCSIFYATSAARMIRISMSEM